MYDYQLDAASKLDSGSILCGGVGSGKSLTSLYYYTTKEMPKLKNLLIITTARKRDSKEWESELFKVGLVEDNEYGVTVAIDSWNNIKKYADTENSFVIFDEQRVVGSGKWAQTFIKIARKNRWILLTATPGDVWLDYCAVFVANNFYRNRTEFINNHVVYSRFTTYPKVERYIHVNELVYFRNKILVKMDYSSKADKKVIYEIANYDKEKFDDTFKNRWDYENGEPIRDAAALCYKLRRISNSSKHREVIVQKIAKEKNRIIVFYNFDYELEMIREAANDISWTFAEWNGHKHEEIPDSETWIYAVQYASGAEAWNCITTDSIVFFSMNYSYKTMVQASGRIDRVNSPYDILYYYIIKTESLIDKRIEQALKKKETFNIKDILK